MIGKTLSHYKVIEKIGSGGFGDVYRAEDTTLKREVAIKVLPEQFTEDPQRLARFEREAQILAQLNHPNIAAIYGLEEADGVRFLALELVPGETLAERVAKGPVPVKEALEVCRQIAEGVEAAHEKGVIHRDLKPANVKVTPEGKVKILDFGLAKAFEEEIPAADISQSPTLTEEMTRAGVILGTAAYMSPEQARGKPVDKRADLFAFGCVLYELLTGKRAFGGETVTDVLAKVLEAEPDWNALPRVLPSTIRFLMSRCLQKDPGRRLQHIDGARILIDEALTGDTMASEIGLGGAIQPPLWKRAIPWGMAVVLAVTTGLVVWSLTRPATQLLAPQSLTKLGINPPASAPLANTRGNEVAISPDGKLVIYRAFRGATAQLYMRSMDELQAKPIVGTAGASANPFFSPDGQWVGFAAAGQLRKAPLAGGPAMTLLDLPGAFRGGDWGSEGKIVFESGTGLHRVSANGGQPEILTTRDPGERLYWAPQILPGGKSVLFTLLSLDGQYHAALLSLQTGEHTIVLEGARAARYAPTGHLVYEAAGTGTLMAVPFDPARPAITGDPVPLLEGVRNHLYPIAGVDYSFSGNGTLVYVPSSESVERRLVWVDHQGTQITVTRERRNLTAPRLSPDGKRVAFQVFGDDGQHLWIYDFESD